MKTALIIALTLVSISAFAGGKKKAVSPEKKAAIESCKAEGKKKAELKECVNAKLAPAAATK